MQVDELGASNDLGLAADSDGRTCLPAQAVAGLLRRLRSSLSSADAATIRQAQHMLDPVRALLEGLETGTVEYDKGQRQAPEELPPSVMLERIDALIAAVGAIAPYEIDRPVHVAAQLTQDGTPHESLSSIGRELMFSFREMSRGLGQ